MYIPTQSTLLPPPPPSTPITHTPADTTTTPPPSTALQDPATPIFTPDTTMNLIFGISAFMMAALAIWQNRQYFRNMWRKNARFPKSLVVKSDKELTECRITRFLDLVGWTRGKEWRWH